MIPSLLMPPLNTQTLRSTVRTAHSRSRLLTQQLQSRNNLLFATSTRMASSDVGELKIENTNINTAAGVSLSEQQKTFVGSVLDLFAGRPSLAKLQLWKDDAVFEDPLTVSRGRKEYEPQWYGLQAAFSEIERLRHEVTSAGNPIEMTMATRYVVKGINQEKTIESVIKIFTEGDKISMVQDKWNGKLPEGSFANAFRRLNATTMPKVVGVPKNSEEDAQKGN